MSDTVKLLELDDDPGKVYLFIDSGYKSQDVADEVMTALDDLFDEAGCLVLYGDVDAGTEVREIDREEFRKVADYHEVMAGVNVDA